MKSYNTFKGENIDINITTLYFSNNLKKSFIIKFFGKFIISFLKYCKIFIEIYIYLTELSY